jgi:hypothetical protein
VYVMALSRPWSICGIIYFKLNGIDVIKNHKTYNYWVTRHHLHKETWNLRVWLACFRFSGDRHVYSLPRTNKVRKNGSTVRTHKNVDCLLKNTPTKTKQMCCQSTQECWWYQFQRTFWEYQSGFLPRKRCVPS